MTIAGGTYTERTRQVGEVTLSLLEGGSGQPTLVLHGIEGDEGWLAFHEALCRRASVLAPSHPGYGRTDCPEWISQVQHMATFYNWFLQDAGLESVDLIGLGLGGWIAAEMAVMTTERLRSLHLVNPAGILPREGEVYDIFVELWRDVINRSFFDYQTSAEYGRIYGENFQPEFGGHREAGRTMTTRLAFRPFMYNPALPGMLGKIRIPTRVIMSDTDRIIPRECGERYQAGIPGAELITLERCGHFAHLDQPDALAEAIHASVAR
ncbi:MAG: alpha/beta fold hydrolase [Chloroflexota bacterium]